MILPGISGFNTIVTGPKKLRSDLRYRTKLIGALSQLTHAVSILRTGFPGDIMGQNLVALMSNRLQYQLKYFDDPSSIDRTHGGIKSRFLPAERTPLQSSSARDEFSVKPIEINSEGARQALNESFRHSASDSFETSIVTDRESPFRPMLPGEMWAPIWEESENYGTRTGIPGNEKKLSGGSAKKVMHSIFVDRLREYWRLAGQEQTMQHSRSPSQTLSEATENKAGFTELPPSGFARASWPESTGEQIDQTIRSLSAKRTMDGSTHSAMRSVQLNQQNGVEIQNVFHIEVKSAVDRVSTSSGELSEQIADILREQAIHHGIDIT